MRKDRITIDAVRSSEWTRKRWNNKWVHYCAAFDIKQDIVTIYLNGVRQGEGSNTG